jgi:hypothetical protein
MVKDMASYGNCVLDASEGRDGARLHGGAIHDHGIERCLAVFIRRSTKAHTAIALIALARRASNLDGIER